MKPLFSNTGLKTFDRFLKQECLLAFDFDGTLVPIVANPDDAHLQPSIFRLLQEITRRFKVAVISGRSLLDLKYRVRLQNVQCVGNHGAEGIARNETEVKMIRESCDRWANGLETALRNENFRGVFLEKKGLSLSFHYRHAIDQSGIRESLFQLLSCLSPRPRIVAGHEVWNVVHPQAPNKGQALLQLLRTHALDHAIYIGDDETDEDVFSLQSDQILGIRVGYSYSSQALYSMDSVHDVAKILQRILKLGKPLQEGVHFG